MKGAKVMAAAALAGSSGAGATSITTPLSTAELMAEFDWASLEPSATLNYTSCYGGEFKCARLLVPLDWLNPDDNVGEEVAIAILTKTAEVDPDHPDYGGTIIVNPGGPNGSGTVFALRAGKVMQVTVDGKKKYDILGFDPRGVGESTPSTDCHRERFARGVAALEDHASGPLEPGSRSIGVKMAYSRGHGRLCERDEKVNRIRQFASTSSVSRDMVRIVDELDKQGLNTGSAQRSGDNEGDDERLELRSARDPTPRIQYWGFSYGTVLGRYFASMFPGRVGRMVLEGVEDTHDFYNGTWITNLLDMNRGIDHFYETCYNGGERCALYKASDSGPEDVRDRVRGFIDNFASPEPFPTEHGYTSIEKADLNGAFLLPVYHPQSSFPILAQTLAEAMEGNYTRLYSSLEVAQLKATCGPDPHTYDWQWDALAAVACGDAVPQYDLTVGDYEDYLRALEADSPEMGPHWGVIRMVCVGWPESLRPKDRFTGPWTTPEPDSSLVEGVPAAPILFTSAEIDPVTPLRNARWASEEHPGSAILVQDNVGHGSLGVPGKCRHKWINKYFEDGEVPPEKETLCKADCVPFQDCRSMNGMEVLKTRDSHARRSWMPLGLNF